MNVPRGLARMPMTHASWRPPLMALTVAILLLASALRFHRLGEQSLWYDEGVAYAHSLRSLPELIPLLQRNVHVPAYFTLLGWWQDLTGSSEVALRALSAFFSVISVAWAFALGRRLIHPLAGLAAAALVALNSFSIYYGQEARMYAMLAAVAGASMWLVAGVLRGPPPPGRRSSAIALGLVNALGIYTHVAFALVIAAQIVLAALWLGGNMLREWRDEGAIRRSLPLLNYIVLANLLTLLLFLPWLPIALQQLPAQPNLSQPVAANELLPELLSVLALGLTYEQSAGSLTFAVAFLLLFGLLPASGRRRSSEILLPLTWLLVSVAIYLYLVLTTRYLRFLLPAQLAMALWLGRGAWMLWTRDIRGRPPLLRAIPELAAAAAFGALLLSQFSALDALYHGRAFQRDDVRGLAARIESDLRADDAVVVSAAGFGEVFGYYYGGATPVYGLPTTNDASATRAQVLEIIGDHDRLHVIFYGAEEQDPERIVETTLNLQAFEISDRWVDDMRYAQYKSGAGHLLPQPADALFGDSITLDSYAVSAREVAAGDVLPVQLVWRTNAALDRRYKVFLQLLDAKVRLVAQRDSEPAGGSAKTTAWPVGEPIVDNHALPIPADLPAGDYRLIVGLYDISDPSARLPVGEGTFVELGTVTLQ